MYLRYALVAALLAFSCTHNQRDRWQEYVHSQSGVWNKTRVANLVRDSLKLPASNRFTLEIKQEAPLATRKGTFPFYILDGESLPTQERLVLAEIEELEQKITPLLEFTVQESGQLTIHSQGDKKQNEWMFKKTDEVKFGRPLKYILVSLQVGDWAETTFQPLRLEEMSRDGAMLSLQASHARFTRFQAKGHGFQPYELVFLRHTSGSMDRIIPVQADRYGAFSHPLSPVEFGYLGGFASIELERELELINLTYPWGSKLEQRSIEEHTIFPILFICNVLENKTDFEREKQEIIAHFFS